MIRDSARTSPTLAKLSHGAERLFWRLTTLADDYGRFNADPSVVRAMCFPLMLEKVKDKTAAGWLDELRAAGLVACYRIGDKHIGYFVTWDKHQRIRAKESKFPAPPSSAAMCCQTPANAAVVVVVDEDEDEGEGEGGDGAAVAAPPGRAASPSLGWNSYLATLSKTDRQVLVSVAEAIATTRKAGKLAPSVLDGLATKLARYSDAVVPRAAHVYLDRGYAADGKDERYFLGIVRGEAKQHSLDGVRSQTVAFQNGTRPKTPGQLAIERALQAQAAEASS